MPPATGAWLTAFTRQYRDAGGEAKFLWTDSHPSYIEMVVEEVGWEALDGTLAVFINGWWGETDLEIVALAEQLLTTYHDDADAIMASGLGYIGSFHMNSLMLDVLAAYLNSVGGPNFSGEGLYEFTLTYTGSWDGYEDWGYTPDTRYPSGYVGIYEVSADAEDLVRLDEDWLPIVYEPQE